MCSNPDTNDWHFFFFFSFFLPPKDTQPFPYSWSWKVLFLYNQSRNPTCPFFKVSLVSSPIIIPFPYHCLVIMPSSLRLPLSLSLSTILNFSAPNPFIFQTFPSQVENQIYMFPLAFKTVHSKSNHIDLHFSCPLWFKYQSSYS